MANTMDGRTDGRTRTLASFAPFIAGRSLALPSPMRGGGSGRERGGVHFLAVFDAAIDSNCEFAPA